MDDSMDVFLRRGQKYYTQKAWITVNLKVCESFSDLNDLWHHILAQIATDAYVNLVHEQCITATAAALTHSVGKHINYNNDSPIVLRTPLSPLSCKSDTPTCPLSTEVI